MNRNRSSNLNNYCLLEPCVIFWLFNDVF